MRRLAKLVDATEGASKCANLFTVGNFYNLEEGIQKFSKADHGSSKALKAGLMVAIGSLIRMSAKILAADCIIHQQVEKACHKVPICYTF